MILLFISHLRALALGFGFINLLILFLVSAPKDPSSDRFVLSKVSCWIFFIEIFSVQDFLVFKCSTRGRGYELELQVEFGVGSNC